MDLAAEPVRSSSSFDALAMGRQLRVLARLLHCPTPYGTLPERPYRLLRGSDCLLACATLPTYGEALALLEADDHARTVLAALLLRGNTHSNLEWVTRLDQLTSRGSNPELVDPLQDLAGEIILDLHDALAAFDDPDVWYPGVDAGIVPVPDEHVQLVIAALQRELNREKRDVRGQNSEPKLPAAPLDQLPWRVQRAVVERRRLRFQQYGIGEAEWRSGKWSLWRVSYDADWRPREVR